MPPHRLIPNSPRKRIAYVKKSMGDRVARATAYVMAHTLGEERIFEDAPIESYFDDGPPHPSEALIPWAGQYLAKLLRAVEKGNLSQDEFFERQDDLERVMPQIATWVHHTRPDLTKLSVDEAMQQASAFEDPGASSDVPQGEVIYRFADGWTIQNLTTPEQIFADGDRVQNCLKEDRYGPGYVDKVRSGDTKIFSLRKPSGIPVISIEYDVPTKLFKQIYAKQNTALGVRLDDLLKKPQWENRPKEAEALWQDIQQYKPRIAEFLTAFGADASAFIMADAPLPAGLTSVDGDLDLRHYNHPLPARLTSVGGYLLNLDRYNHPLPAGLTSVGGGLNLDRYNHPLPAGLTSVGGGLHLKGYKHPLPAGLTSVGGGLILTNYAHPLPAGLTSVSNYLDLSDYPHPLPAGLTSVGGALNLTNYKHPLPAGLTSVGGDLYMTKHNHPLPAGLTSVGGELHLYKHEFPLPAGLREVGGNLNLMSYKFPLPEGLESVGGVLSLYNYKHPLPERLTHVGGYVDAADYPYSLAQLGIESVGDRLRKNPRRTSRLPARKTSKRARRTSRK